MLNIAEFVRFHLLLCQDPELAEAALRKIAEWRNPPSPSENILPSPDEALRALFSDEANENFASLLRSDRAENEARFILGKQIIRLPDGRKVRPTVDGYIYVV